MSRIRGLPNIQVVAYAKVRVFGFLNIRHFSNRLIVATGRIKRPGGNVGVRAVTEQKTDIRKFFKLPPPASASGRMSCNISATDGSLPPKPGGPPFSLLLPVPPPGAEGDQTDSGSEATFRIKQTGRFSPPLAHGAKPSRNKQRSERSDLHQAADQLPG